MSELNQGIQSLLNNLLKTMKRLVQGWSNLGPTRIQYDLPGLTFIILQQQHAILI